jgi:hypothetical protein
MPMITKRQQQLVYVFLVLGVLLGLGIGQLVPLEAQVSNSVRRLTYPAVVTIETKETLGSGFFISPVGHVLTCDHVLADGHGVTVVTSNGERLPAAVVATEPQKDLAVLKVEAAHTPLLRLGGNNTAHHERVYLFGHRQGSAEWTDGQLITADLWVEGQRYMQIQGKVVPGYSGGPLLDPNGNVLGLLTQLIEGTDLALAIPARVISGFLSDHRVAHSFVDPDLLLKGNPGRRWTMPPESWTNLSATGKGAVLLLPGVVIAALIYFLRWYQRCRRRRREDDFEIEFTTGSGF